MGIVLGPSDTGAELAAKLVCRSEAARMKCVKLSATRWIPVAEWDQLKGYEQEFLRCYAIGLAARTSVLAGRSAASVAGMWVLPTEGVPVELINQRARPVRSQWPEGVIYRRHTLYDDDIISFDEPHNIRCTRPVRTAIDIARFHGFREGVVAFDSLFNGLAMWERAAMTADITETLERMAGTRNIQASRAAFAACNDLSESPYETVCRLMLLEEGIIVEVQKKIGNYRVDLLWGNLIIEIDGRMKYADVPHDVLDKQMRRENWLKEQGYEVIRIYPSQLLADETAVLARILAAKERADLRGTPRVKAR